MRFLTTHTQVKDVKKGVQIESLSIIWMVIEAVVAVAAGVIAHSLALVAFGADSIIELIAGGVLLWRLLVEVRGASVERIQAAEKKASWIVGVSLMLLALYIVVASLYKLFTQQGAQSSIPGLLLALASGFIMIYVSRAKKRIGTEIGSAALRADGSCSIVCAYMAWTVLAGVALNSLLGWWWIDSVAALGLVYFIVSEGWEAIQEARGVEIVCHCDD